ncbi:MAG: hypothetical protein ACP5NG_03660 [Conexivisphaera sp.]
MNPLLVQVVDYRWSPMTLEATKAALGAAWVAERAPGGGDGRIHAPSPYGLLLWPAVYALGTLIPPLEKCRKPGHVGFFRRSDSSSQVTRPHILSFLWLNYLIISNY